MVGARILRSVHQPHGNARAAASDASAAANAVRNGASTASSAKATSSAWRSIAHSSASDSPIVSIARTYSSDSDRSLTVVSSVLQRDRDAGPMEPGERMGGQRRHDAGLPVGGRAQVERHPPRDELGAQRRVVDGAGTVGDPLRVERERPRDLGRAAPLAGVEGDPQAAGARGLEGARRGRAGPGRPPRVRPGPSRSGPRRGTAAAVSARITFAAGSCERRAVQMSRTTVPVRAARRGRRAQTAAIPSASDSPPATWSSGPQRIST